MCLLMAAIPGIGVWIPAMLAHSCDLGLVPAPLIPYFIHRNNGVAQVRSHIDLRRRAAMI